MGLPSNSACLILCVKRSGLRFQAAVLVLKAVSGETVCNHQKLIEFRSELVVDSENTHSFHDISPFLLANVKRNFSEPALLLGALIGKNGTCNREGNGGEKFVSEVGKGIAETRGEAEIVVIVVGGNQVTHSILLLSFVRMQIIVDSLLKDLQHTGETKACS